jgi:hypothetical protein
MRLISILKNGLKHFKGERKMPVCLECGAHAESVTLLWNDKTHRDERFCFHCAREFKREHPNCTPHGVIYDAPGGLQGEEMTVKQFQVTPSPKCEMCGCTTVNKELLDGVLLCYGCKAQFENYAFDAAEKAKARKAVGGTNGIVLMPAAAQSTEIIKRHWCNRCRKMQLEEEGHEIPGTQRAWWCNSCIEETEGVMENWHVKLHIKGSEEDIEFFHWMMRRLDTDWEGGGDFKATEFCEICGGWEWKNPRMKPEQIKKLGKLAGLRKVKVQFWGKARACDEKVVARRFAEQKMIEGMVG